MKRKRTIRICSREWKLVVNHEGDGASFKTYCKNGDGLIAIGTKGQTNRTILELLTHEVMEGILSHDCMR